jgi:hypothetical protein
MDERDFHIGDRVRFLNEAGEGIVTGFPARGILMVRDQSGFEYEHPVTELVPVSDKFAERVAYDSVQPEMRDLVERNIDPVLASRAHRDFKELYKEKQGVDRQKGDTMEVDLHIHEILDRHEHMQPGEMLSIQIDHFERTLRIAEEKKIPRCIFIHGVGQGVLRNEIRRVLQEYYPNATFMDAPYAEYGFGATEVRLRFGGRQTN